MSDLNALSRGASLPGGDGVRTVAYTGADGSRKKGASSWGRTRQSYADAYRAQRDANKRARKRAEDRARRATDAQIDALNREFRGTERQLYRDYMRQQRSLPQQMAAQGYTGGLAESSRLRLGSAYEEGLNSSEQARLGKKAELKESLNQRLYEARAAADEADSRARQDYYDKVGDLDAQRRKQQREDLEKRAAAMAASGDFRLYKKLGYSDREVAYLKKMYRRQHPELFGDPNKPGGARR